MSMHKFGKAWLAASAMSAAALYGPAGLAQTSVSPDRQPGNRPSSTHPAPTEHGQPQGAPSPQDEPTLPKDTPQQGTVGGEEQPGRTRHGTGDIAPAAPKPKETPNVGGDTASDAAGPGTGRSGSGGSGNAPGPGS